MPRDAPKVPAADGEAGEQGDSHGPEPSPRVALAEDGRTTSKGMPKPLDLALFVREFSDEVQGAFPPVWVQRLTLAPVAWLARKRGLAARYTPRPAGA